VPADMARTEAGSNTITAPKQLSRTGLIGRADDVRC
jgi:hypothetical protein